MLSSSARRRVAAAIVLFAALPVVACSKKSEDAPVDPATMNPTVPTTAAPPPAQTLAATTAAAVPAGPPGTIAGVVHLTGAAPAAKDIAKPTDPVCAAASPKDDSISVGKDKGLKDVVVRIEPNGAHGSMPSTTPQLKQEGCMYVPHVVGLMAGQDIEILNADKTMHNVHTYKDQDTVINAGQPAGSQPIKKVASDDPGILRVKCDVHPWMTAYMVVTDHPFFAVTDANGKYSITGVPAGTYRLEAWHPELGLIEKKDVVVEGGKSVDPGFSYTGAEKKPN